MSTAPLHDLEGVPVSGQAKFVTTQDGTQIRIAYWQGGERGTVLLFPGRTEYAEKYGRMVAKLQERNFNVVVFDWRGQGLSDRPDNRRDRGYVGHFNEYQQDITAALALPEIMALQGPRLLMSHSMGGCIALRAIVEGLDVKAAIFSSPMWGLPGQRAAKFALSVVNTFGRPFGKHKSLVPGTKPTYYVTANPFEGNELTNNPDYYAMFKAHLAAQPELGLGGPTIHWAAEAIKEMDALLTSAVPDIPILTFAGTQEIVVDGETIKSRATSFPNGQLEVIKDAKHEIWMETPEIQTQVWNIMDKFLADIV